MTASSGSLAEFLVALQNFQKQANDTAGQHELVSLFCLQIIPLLNSQPSIASLRTHWVSKREKLLRDRDFLVERVLGEIRHMVSNIKSIIKTAKNGPIALQIQTIEDMFVGRCKEFSSWPLYYSLANKTRELLQLLAQKPQYHALCKKYALLGTQNFTQNRRMDHSNRKKSLF